MPRSQANLKLTVMQGLRGLSLEAKLLYFELLVEPSLSQCGVGVYRPDWWARETELDLEATHKALDELEASRYVFADPDAGEVLVRTLIRRDGIAEKPNQLWAACRAAPLIRSVKLRHVVAEELRKLPPKPPPTVSPKNGRAYEHPDPHATADQIDPSGDPDDPTGERISNHSGTVPGPIKPSGPNGSGTIREPIGAEPFENHSRTLGGGGGGGGSSSPTSPSRSTSVSSAASKSTTDRARTRGGGRGEVVRASDLNATAHRPQGHVIVSAWADTSPGTTSAKRRDLIKAVDALLTQGAIPDLLPDALDEVHRPHWRNPIAGLPHAYEQVRRLAYPAPTLATGTDGPPRSPTRAPTTTQRVADALSLLRPDGDEP